MHPHEPSRHKARHVVQDIATTRHPHLHRRGPGLRRREVGRPLRNTRSWAITTQSGSWSETSRMRALIIPTSPGAGALRKEYRMRRGSTRSSACGRPSSAIQSPSGAMARSTQLGNQGSRRGVRQRMGSQPGGAHNLTAEESRRSDDLGQCTHTQTHCSISGLGDAFASPLSGMSAC